MKTYQKYRDPVTNVKEAEFHPISGIPLATLRQNTEAITAYITQELDLKMVHMLVIFFDIRKKTLNKTCFSAPTSQL